MVVVLTKLVAVVVADFAVFSVKRLYLRYPGRGLQVDIKLEYTSMVLHGINPAARKLFLIRASGYAERNWNLSI